MLNISAAHAALADMMKALEVIGKRMPAAQALVLNRVTTRTRAVVVPTLTKQTGLSKRIITKAVKTRRASPENPRASLYTRGGDISLKYFGAREQDGGVVANVKGDRVFVQGGFRRSGPPGRRVLVTKLGGHVFTNSDGGTWKGHFQKEKSQVFIPAEMIRGETLKAFYRVVETELPNEIAKELAKILPGA